MNKYKYFSAWKAGRLSGGNLHDNIKDAIEDVKKMASSEKGNWFKARWSVEDLILKRVIIQGTIIDKKIKK